MLTLFVGRLIVDDAMPPSFLTSVLPSLEDSSLGVAIVRGAGDRSPRAPSAALSFWEHSFPIPANLWV